MKTATTLCYDKQVATLHNALRDYLINTDGIYENRPTMTKDHPLLHDSNDAAAAMLSSGILNEVLETSGWSQHPVASEGRHRLDGRRGRSEMVGLRR